MLAVEFIDSVWLIGIAVPGGAIKNGTHRILRMIT